MEKVTWKGGTLLSPLPPALVSCGSMEKPNVLTVAWTGILCSDPPRTYVSIRPSRYSYELIKESGEFVINLPDETLARAADYCGVHSGRNKNKFEVMELEAMPCTKLSCPQIGQAPLSLECKVFDVIPLGSHDMFLADIVAVNVAADLIDEGGKLHLEKRKPIAYAHGEYYALGKKLGAFGHSVAKKRRHKTTRK